MLQGVARFLVLLLMRIKTCVCGLHMPSGSRGNYITYAGQSVKSHAWAQLGKKTKKWDLPTIGYAFFPNSNNWFGLVLFLEI